MNVGDLLLASVTEAQLHSATLPPLSAAPPSWDIQFTTCTVRKVLAKFALYVTDDAIAVQSSTYGYVA